MSRLIKIIFIFTVFLSLSGCVIFKGNNFEKVDLKQINTTSQKKKKIYVRWDFDFLPMGQSSLTYEDRDRLFKKVLNESECCELVQKKSEADLIFEGKAYDQRNSARLLGFFLSTLTVYIIPSWHTAKIHVAAEVKNNQKNHHYQVVESMTTAIWLPFVVAAPFVYDFDKTQKEILENSYKNIFLQIQGDGFFDEK